MDPRSKVDYDALYLEWEAGKWHQTVQETHPSLNWKMFTNLLLQHFSSNSQDNLIGKFNKLMQTHTVEAYIGQFEELRSHLLAIKKLLTEEFYVASCLSGLRQDIQQALYVYKFNTLQEVMVKDKEQEVLVNLLERRTANIFKSQPKGFSNSTLGDKNREGSYRSKGFASSDLNKLKYGSNHYPFFDGNLTHARFKKNYTY
ncbi:hypothetical protein AgCh_023694 [Apium graveolens]